MSDFAGKVVLVTGAAGGIGSVSADRFADAGATLVVTDRKGSQLGSAAEALRRRGVQVSSFECDLADEGAAVDLVEMIRVTHGRLDVIDHVIGATTGLGQDGIVTELDADLWDSFLAINARGAMLLAKHSIPLLFAAGGGAIVFTSAGLPGFGDDQAPAHSAGKVALETLARSIATPFRKQGIRCNCVAPGLVQTDAVSKAVPDTRKSVTSAQTMSYRLGLPEDIARAALFLASEKAAFINGAVLLVEGGNLIHESHTAAIHELRNAGLGCQDKGKS
ncbi:SDR family NAD(P)-dependent oxidoreductase [Streptomyces sp. NPDC002328]|uniref:SDR family NAD(P)-dependent oxidoreductase n=1 Tax=Streptomyces sp. NPDC002328 TaxID=3364642 RepID=UPI003696B31D